MNSYVLNIIKYFLEIKLDWYTIFWGKVIRLDIGLDRFGIVIFSFFVFLSLGIYVEVILKVL